MERCYRGIEGIDWLRPGITPPIMPGLRDTGDEYCLDTERKQWRRTDKCKWEKENREAEVGVLFQTFKYSTFLTHLHSPLFVAPGSGCGPGLMEEKLTTRFNFVESTFYKWIWTFRYMSSTEKTFLLFQLDFPKHYWLGFNIWCSPLENPVCAEVECRKKG